MINLYKKGNISWQSLYFCPFLYFTLFAQNNNYAQVIQLDNIIIQNNDLFERYKEKAYSYGIVNTLCIRAYITK